MTFLKLFDAVLENIVVDVVVVLFENIVAVCLSMTRAQ
jgi:hypothetical protein